VSRAGRAHDNTATRAHKWLHRHFPHFVDCRPIEVLADVRAAGFQDVAFESMSIWGLQGMAVTAQRPFGLVAENPGAD
jgi:demethylmenaquinone methyltransferase/2-methoxy-6-polyprenyl-1,4-benzoquinol methylase